MERPWTDIGAINSIGPSYTAEPAPSAQAAPASSQSLNPDAQDANANSDTPTLQSARDAVYASAPTPQQAAQAAQTGGPAAPMTPLRMAQMARAAQTQQGGPAPGQPGTVVPSQLMQNQLTAALIRSINTLPAQMREALADLRSPQAVILMLQFVNTAQTMGNSAAASRAASDLAQFVLATLSAVTPADQLRAGMMFNALLSTHGQETIRSLIAQLPQLIAQMQSQAPIAQPAFGPPGRLREARDKEKAKSERPGLAAGKPEEERRPEPVAERDARGRPYSQEQKKMLAALGPDPRRGAAPETAAAMMVMESWGVTLTRSSDPSHDFIDQNGEFWDVITPRRSEGLSAEIDALTYDANVIVNLSTVDQERATQIARAASAPGATERFGNVTIVGVE